MIAKTRTILFAGLAFSTAIERRPTVAAPAMCSQTACKRVRSFADNQNIDLARSKGEGRGAPVLSPALPIAGLPSSLRSKARQRPLNRRWRALPWTRHTSDVRDKSRPELRQPPKPSATPLARLQVAMADFSFGLSGRLRSRTARHCSDRESRRDPRRARTVRS